MLRKKRKRQTFLLLTAFELPISIMLFTEITHLWHLIISFYPTTLESFICSCKMSFFFEGVDFFFFLSSYLSVCKMITFLTFNIFNDLHNMYILDWWFSIKFATYILENIQNKWLQTFNRLPTFSKIFILFTKFYLIMIFTRISYKIA